MCLFVLHLPLLLPCLLFTRYLRIPHMYFATPAVLAGVGGGAVDIALTCLDTWKGCPAGGGTGGRGGALSEHQCTLSCIIIFDYG